MRGQKPKHQKPRYQKPGYRKYCTGFTYLGLLFLITIIGITLAMASTLWSFAQQREKERELIFIGHQFRHAIGLYYERTPGANKQYPNRLQDLLLDSRYVTNQRYLRRVYSDPMTGNQDWGLVPAPGGGIMGVYSKSEAVPIKTGNFKVADSALESTKKYTEWQFVYTPFIAGK